MLAHVALALALALERARWLRGRAASAQRVRFWALLIALFGVPAWLAARALESERAWATAPPEPELPALVDLDAREPLRAGSA